MNFGKQSNQVFFRKRSCILACKIFQQATLYMLYHCVLVVSSLHTKLSLAWSPGEFLKKTDRSKPAQPFERAKQSGVVSSFKVKVRVGLVHLFLTFHVLHQVSHHCHAFLFPPAFISESTRSGLEQCRLSQTFFRYMAKRQDTNWQDSCKKGIQATILVQSGLDWSRCAYMFGTSDKAALKRHEVQLVQPCFWRPGLGTYCNPCKAGTNL